MVFHQKDFEIVKLKKIYQLKLMENSPKLNVITKNRMKKNLLKMNITGGFTAVKKKLYFPQFWRIYLTQEKKLKMKCLNGIIC